MSVDYWALMGILAAVEAVGLFTGWTRWQRDEYHHQFHHNIGIGNVKQVRKMNYSVLFPDCLWTLMRSGVLIGMLLGVYFVIVNTTG